MRKQCPQENAVDYYKTPSNIAWRYSNANAGLCAPFWRRIEILRVAEVVTAGIFTISVQVAQSISVVFAVGSGHNNAKVRDQQQGRCARALIYHRTPSFLV